MIHLFLWILLFFTSYAFATDDSECIENGGKAHCIAPKLSDWKITYCIPAAAYASRHAALCKAKGGTYMGAVAKNCPGEQPLTQENYIDVAQKYVSYSNSLCKIESTNISSWGNVTADGWYCQNIEKQIDEGHEIYSGQTLTFTGKSSSGSKCDMEGKAIIYARRSRKFVCPDGFLMRADKDGNKECYQLQHFAASPKENGSTMCATPQAPTESYESDTQPSKGEPIRIGTGNMYHIDTDLSGPLPLVRTYNSSLGRWTFNTDIRLQLTNSTTVLHFGDGKQFTYSKVENNWESDPDVYHHLEEINEPDLAWRITFADNSQALFDDAGRIRELKWLQGKSIYYEHTTDNTVITDQFQNKLVLNFDRNHQLIKATLNNTTSISYKYDDQQRLIKAIFSDDTARHFLYENNQFPNYLTGIINANGKRVITWEYDSIGRALSSERADNKERFTFDYLDNQTTVTNPLGKKTTYHFTSYYGVKKVTKVEGHASANCAAANREYTYYGNGLLKSKTDWKDVTTTYEYNDRGLLTQKTIANGSPEAITVQKQWHVKWRLPVSITIGKATTLYLYDHQGRLSKKTEGFDLKNESINEEKTLSVSIPEDLKQAINPEKTTLSWSLPEINQPVIYDLYLGESNPPTLYKQGLTTSEITLETLNSNQQYNWKVIVKDLHNQVLGETAINLLQTGNSAPSVPKLSSVTKQQEGLLFKWLKSEDPNPSDQVAGYHLLVSEVQKDLVSVSDKITENQYLLNQAIEPNTFYHWSVISTDNHGKNSLKSTPSIFSLINFENQAFFEQFYWFYSGDQRWSIHPAKDGQGFNWQTTLAVGEIAKAETQVNLTSPGSISLSLNKPYGSQLSLYIDGKLALYWTRKVVIHQQVYEYQIPSGHHTIRLEASQRIGNGYIELDNLILPALSDSDTDGVKDGWEYQFYGSLNQNFINKDLDTDGDNLTDLQEHQYATNPTKSDTDDDGMLDKWEIDNHSNPTEYDANQDADSDGVNNLSEYILSNQNHSSTADFDKDGMPDRWEVTHSLNPAINDRMEDSDNDGAVNYEEYIADTDPKNSTHYQRIMLDFENQKLGGYYWVYSEQGRWQIQKAKDGSSHVWRPELTTGQKAKVSTQVNVKKPGFIIFKITKPAGSQLSLLVNGKLVEFWHRRSSQQHQMYQYALPSGKNKIVFEASQRMNTGYVELDNIILPALPDSDGDDVQDGWEYLHFDSLNHDLYQDTDKDGITDFDEYKAGTNPHDDLTN